MSSLGVKLMKMTATMGVIAISAMITVPIVHPFSHDKETLVAPFAILAVGAALAVIIAL